MLIEIWQLVISSGQEARTESKFKMIAAGDTNIVNCYLLIGNCPPCTLKIEQCNCE